MSGRTIACLALAIVMLAPAVQLAGQQFAGPVPCPRASTPTAALLVICDLACHWKLDGKAMGAIEAGGAARVQLELGQHVVLAATEDEQDHVQQVIAVREEAQSAVVVELKPLREARLRSERDTQERSARERQESERQSGERSTRDELSRLIWSDPATGLMWSRRDNGFQLLKWSEAPAYCQLLRLGGFADWRWPTLDELESINDPWNLRSGQGAVKGGIQTSGDFVLGYTAASLRRDGVQEIKVWSFHFGDGEHFSGMGGRSRNRVLCVRHAAN